MIKLPVLSGPDVIKILKKAGWTPARQKGSHIILVKHTPEGKRGVVVPNHREVDVGTLSEIIRQVGLTRKEFLDLMRKK
ncbi:MAG TPA: type II toxin-antitoxin system HicA family toxin [Euryarchaeota archaeon]|nr:YcfA-like protein [archaeon BMS3Bbin15]HDL15580.1 type II toxin-antitoxin system HicA family toxin [Euryarchaeota archaeon]